jgi:hypothetical protein
VGAIVSALQEQAVSFGRPPPTDTHPGGPTWLVAIVYASIVAATLAASTAGVVTTPQW